MREKRFFQKVERYFSPEETTSSNQRVLGENALKDIPRKQILENKKEERSALEAGIINLHDLKVAPLSKNWARAEISTTPSKIKTRREKKLSYSGNSKQCSPTRAAKPSVTVDVVKKMSVEAEKVSNDKQVS